MDRKWVRNWVGHIQLDEMIDFPWEDKKFGSSEEVANYALSEEPPTKEGLKQEIDTITKKKGSKYSKFQYEYECNTEYYEDGAKTFYSITIYGLRKETDKEYNRRVKREEAKKEKEKEQAEKKKERQYKEYLKLKKKFEREK